MGTVEVEHLGSWQGLTKTLLKIIRGQAYITVETCSLKTRICISAFAQPAGLHGPGASACCYTQVLIGIGKLGALGDHEEQVNGRREAKRVKED